MTGALGEVVAVASGKGGVGKSTISLNVALALVQSGARVGLLDADLYGPDIPLMVNVKQTRSLKRWDFWRAGAPVELEPVERFGLRIMSVGFLLAETQGLAWPATSIQMIANQLVDGVAWGDLDYLLVDLPPGSADVQQQLFSLLPLAGAILVVAPQDAAHLDAKRVLELLTATRVRVLGAVENMSGFSCPHCGEPVEVFPRVPEQRSLWALGVRRLGSIPLDPAVAAAGDKGLPVVVADPAGVHANAFRAVATELAAALAR